MNETENQAINSFVSAFETEAAKIGIPKKIATCGAIFTIGAQMRAGLKIVLDAPTASGKTMLLRDFIFPLTDAVELGLMNPAPTPKKLEDRLSELKSAGGGVFIVDQIDCLPKECDPILAEWNGSVLLCAGTFPGNIQRRPLRGFECVTVSKEDGKFGKVPPRGGQKPDISGLRERLGQLPVIGKDSLLERVQELGSVANVVKFLNGGA